MMAEPRLVVHVVAHEVLTDHGPYESTHARGGATPRSLHGVPWDIESVGSLVAHRGQRRFNLDIAAVGTSPHT